MNVVEVTVSIISPRQLIDDVNAVFEWLAFYLNTAALTLD